MDIKQAIAKVIERQDLTHPEMTTVMQLIMTGGATPAQIAGFLVALRMKGETVTEITAAAAVMRALATPVDLHDFEDAVDIVDGTLDLERPRLGRAVDIVGTGGDGAGTFNVSTASMFVAAAAGCHVAKHGNRSVSSRSGSADVLEAAGVRLDLTPAQVAQCVRDCGVGFMFAPGHHGAMKHAIAPRRELGVRTLFNILGPLTNPAGVPNQVLGVFGEELLIPLAEVLQRLGSHHVMVVHSRDGLDEISIGDNTEVAELKEGEVLRFALRPEDYGLARAHLDAIRVSGPEDSLMLLKAVLDGQPGPARDIVLLNAGAAIYVSGVTPSLAEGVRWAGAAIDSGEARRRFERLVALTQGFA
ncbi:MAG: anthranilate phosphoribosyltransferase [Chromatiaceae bacterium]|nr:anthranilate phosphoribosyltransferase [Chromatiaceae bacterium]